MTLLEHPPNLNRLISPHDGRENRDIIFSDRYELWRLNDIQGRAWRAMRRFGLVDMIMKEVKMAKRSRRTIEALGIAANFGYSARSSNLCKYFG